MQDEFNNKNVLVTGAGSGIGRELVKKLISFGANVIAVSQSETKLKSLELEVKDGPGKLTIIPLDLSNWSQTDKTLGKLCENVDFLVNNAGCSINNKIQDQTERDLDTVLAINLKSPINLIRLVSPGMIARKSGSIVNISSVAGIVALDEHLAYASSKAALDMVTKISAKELGIHNIRVNSVNPTVVWTDMSRKFWTDPKKCEKMQSLIPMNRFVEVHEVVEPILFLLSSKSSMINGITMPIDGGFVAT